MERQRKWTRLGRLGGAALVVLIGLMLVRYPRLGGGLSELSYDLPFFFRSNLRVTNTVLVTLDRQTQAEALKEDGRQLHARLLRRLTTDGAGLVFYDLIFDKPKPEADEAFAQAIQEHGRVILGATTEENRRQSEAAPVGEEAVMIPPTEALRRAARGTGLVQLPEADVARAMFLGGLTQTAAVWVAASLVRAPGAAPLTNRFIRRWLYYYGPTGEPFDQIDFQRALQPDGVPPDFFRGKTVFIGGQPAELTKRCETDVFGTPYSRFGHGFSPGVELLATEFTNLARGEWLEPVSERGQLALVTVWGLIAGLGLLGLRPWHAAWVALLAMALLAWGACRLQLDGHLWCAWLVPVAVQTPMALVWSVGYQYTFESRRARKLRKAFAAYLSPEMAERIARSDVDVSLGGHEVEATILFTDLEGFATMTETLSPPEVSRLLIAYFNRTTRHILERQGMISKYVGDAVMAIWGAPLPCADHAEQAVLAACGIIEAGQTEIEGRRLRTRIGINTGLTLAGNLGSEFRFDYTAIGATTNLASRIEGANQFLGTNILISEATRRQLSARIAVRRLGRFLVKGIRQPVVIFEVLGTTDRAAAAPAWVALFEQAVELFVRREWDGAEELFRKVLEWRQGQDGPAKFYLAHLAECRQQPAAAEPWDGVIKLGA